MIAMRDLVVTRVVLDHCCPAGFLVGYFLQAEKCVGLVALSLGNTEEQPVQTVSILAVLVSFEALVT